MRLIVSMDLNRQRAAEAILADIAKHGAIRAAGCDQDAIGLLMKYGLVHFASAGQTIDFTPKGKIESQTRTVRAN
ncbi:hypothetical protein CK222_03465 [Mesorhizobium sp. WSM3866]|uniref:hypothetical protein n=1 Tax=Mesorhizobium sp. WSM3866 TaxID=422271 RepID=UPI000BAE8B3E|nr:hypothetical protein [Mesorhizobium sp. WSM3866]PBB45546.1 hypothetical protein CK222_03465 [Mesorhizobium sp. WSM3866]